MTGPNSISFKDLISSYLSKMKRPRRKRGSFDKWIWSTRHYTAEMTRELFREALPGDPWEARSERINFQRLAGSITSCMADYDETMGLPIFHTEVIDVRGSLLHVRNFLDVFTNRINEERQALKDALSRELDPDLRSLYETESEGMSHHLLRLQCLSNGLDPYFQEFRVDLVTAKSWHVYALNLFVAFKDSVPPFSPRKPWGVSKGGPPVLFVTKALDEILAHPKNARKNAPKKPTPANVVDAISSQRAKMRTKLKAR